MKITHIFKGEIPKNISLAEVAIMETLEDVPSYYKELLDLNEVIVTDYPSNEIGSIIPPNSFLGKFIVVDISTKMFISDFKFKFASMYAKLFLHENPTFVETLEEQSKSVEKNRLSTEEIYSHAFAVFVTGLNTDEVEDLIMSLFKKADRLLMLGYFTNTRE